MRGDGNFGFGVALDAAELMTYKAGPQTTNVTPHLSVLSLFVFRMSQAKKDRMGRNFLIHRACHDNITRREAGHSVFEDSQRRFGGDQV